MRSFRTTVRRALARSRRLLVIPERSGRRSLALGSVLLVASAITVLATANTAPEITGLSISESVIDEGQTVTVSGTFTDPDEGDRHTVAIHWNDPNNPGGKKVELPVGQRDFEVTHTYTNELPPRNIMVVVADHQLPPGTNDNTEGQGRDTGSLPIEVKNVAPTFARGISVTRPSAQAGRVVVQGDLIDPGADTLQVVALWGDAGTRPPPRGQTGATRCTVDERHFRCEHTYRIASSATTGSGSTSTAITVPRTYTVRLAVKDDDGGEGTTTVKVQVP